MTRATFALSLHNQGQTVMFRNPDTMRYVFVRPIDWAKKVALRDGRIYVNGNDATDWTVCRKP